MGFDIADSVFVVVPPQSSDEQEDLWIHWAHPNRPWMSLLSFKKYRNRIYNWVFLLALSLSGGKETNYPLTYVDDCEHEISPKTLSDKLGSQPTQGTSQGISPLGGARFDKSFWTLPPRESGRHMAVPKLWRCSKDPAYGLKKQQKRVE